MGTVLLLQADPVLRGAWSRALQGRHAVIATGQLEIAISHAREGAIDVVVFDASDREPDGRLLIEELDRLPEPPPVILVSSSPRAPEPPIAGTSTISRTPAPSSRSRARRRARSATAARSAQALDDLALVGGIELADGDLAGGAHGAIAVDRHGGVVPTTRA